MWRWSRKVDPLNASDKTTSEMSEEEMRDRVIRLAFGGDPNLFREFCDTLRERLPAGAGAVLRGSAVTGERWDDGAPFDAEGPGTSDLDLTLIGAEAINLFKAEGFFIPMVHSKPLSDKDPDIAPDLVPLRETLQRIANRPVNIQATRDFVRFLRGDLIGQPYLTLIEKAEDS
jgi:hypothetical protein